MNYAGFLLEIATDNMTPESKAQALAVLESCGLSVENIERAFAAKDEIKDRFQIDIERLMVAHDLLSIGPCVRESQTLYDYADACRAAPREPN